MNGRIFRSINEKRVNGGTEQRSKGATEEWSKGGTEQRRNRATEEWSNGGTGERLNGATGEQGNGGTGKQGSRADCNGLIGLSRIIDISDFDANKIKTRAGAGCHYFLREKPPTLIRLKLRIDPQD